MEQESSDSTKCKVMQHTEPRLLATQLAFIEFDCLYVREGDRYINGFGSRYFV